MQASLSDTMPLSSFTWDDIMPVAVAKTFTVALLALGWFYHEAPDKTLRLYGFEIPEMNTALLFDVVETWGASVFSIGIVGFCLLLQESTVNTAVAWYCVYWAQEHVRAVLKEIEKKAGGNPAVRYFWILIATFCAYACFTDASYSNSVTKVIGALTVAQGLPMAIAPQTSLVLTIGNKKEDYNILTTTMVRMFGFVLSSAGVLLAALCYGFEPVRAMGSVNLLSAIKIVWLLYITQDLVKCNMNLKPVYGWLFFHTFAAWLCLLSG